MWQACSDSTLYSSTEPSENVSYEIGAVVEHSSPHMKRCCTVPEMAYAAPGICARYLHYCRLMTLHRQKRNAIGRNQVFTANRFATCDKIRITMYSSFQHRGA